MKTAGQKVLMLLSGILKKINRRRKLKTITLERFCYHPEGTLGVIRVDGELFYSVEKPWLDNAPNVSCVPEGTYKTGWRDSPKFGETWHIKDVPNRTYILIHAANYPTDVHGCIGLGMQLMADRIAVGHSRKAVNAFEKLTKGSEWQLIVTHAPLAGLQSR
jgi:hypothetical protein|tara:strand:+ start:173 stop:655 length:483 start_codon:yes stop_codon:yes gene_type:complete